MIKYINYRYFNLIKVIKDIDKNNITNKEINFKISEKIYKKIEKKEYKDGHFLIEKYIIDFEETFNDNLDLDKVLYYIKIRNKYLTELEIYHIMKFLIENDLVNKFWKNDSENLILIKKLIELEYDNDLERFIEIFSYTEQFGYLGNVDLIKNYLKEANRLFFNGSFSSNYKLLENNNTNKLNYYEKNYNILLSNPIFNTLDQDNQIEKVNDNIKDSNISKYKEFYYPIKNYYIESMVNKNNNYVDILIKFIEIYYRSLKFYDSLRNTDLGSAYEFSNFELNFSKSFYYFNLDNALNYLEIFDIYIIKGSQDNENQTDPVNILLNSEKLDKLDYIFSVNIELLDKYQIIKILYLFAKGNSEGKLLINELILDLVFKKFSCFNKYEINLIVQMIWSLCKLINNSDISYIIINNLIKILNNLNYWNFIKTPDFKILIISLNNINFGLRSFWGYHNKDIVNTLDLSLNEILIILKQQIMTNCINNELSYIKINHDYLKNINDDILIKIAPMDILPFYVLIYNYYAKNELNNYPFIKGIKRYLKSNKSEYLNNKEYSIVERVNLLIISLFTMYIDIESFDKISENQNYWIDNIKPLINNIKRNNSKMETEFYFLIYLKLGEINLKLFDNNFIINSRKTFYEELINKIKQLDSIDELIRFLEICCMTGYKDDTIILEFIELKILEDLYEYNIKELTYIIVLLRQINTNINIELDNLLIEYYKALLINIEEIDEYYEIYKNIFDLNIEESENIKLLENDKTFELITSVGNNLTKQIYYNENNDLFLYDLYEIQSINDSTISDINVSEEVFMRYFYYKRRQFFFNLNDN